MVETALSMLGVGFITFFAAAGLYERFERPHPPKVANLFLILAFSTQVFYYIIVSGEGGFVSVSLPEWVGELNLAVSVALFALPGYVLWRWSPESLEALTTDRQRLWYRLRWFYVGFGVIIGGIFILFLGWLAVRSSGLF